MCRVNINFQNHCTWILGDNVSVFAHLLFCRLNLTGAPGYDAPCFADHVRAPRQILWRNEPFHWNILERDKQAGRCRGGGVISRILGRGEKRASASAARHPNDPCALENGLASGILSRRCTVFIVMRTEARPVSPINFRRVASLARDETAVPSQLQEQPSGQREAPVSPVEVKWRRRFQKHQKRLCVTLEIPTVGSLTSAITTPDCQHHTYFA